MTAASNSEARKRLADPTPHTDPTAAAVRAAQDPTRPRLLMLLDLAVETNRLTRDEVLDVLDRFDRADRLATDPAAPVAVEDSSGTDETPCDVPSQRGVETVETLAEVLAAHWEIDVDNGGDQTEFFCDGCKVTLAVGAGADTDAAHRAHVAEHLAARIVQARAGEGALRERIEALAAEWLAAGDAEGATAADDRVIGAWYGAGCRLRAALDPEATT